MKGDIFYNPPIMFAVAESDLQRFRELETENNLLKVQTECLAKENAILKEKLEVVIKNRNELLNEISRLEDCVAELRECY